VLWFPEQELGVAVVSGLASFDSGGTANKVAEVFLGDKLTPKQPSCRSSLFPKPLANTSPWSRARLTGMSVITNWIAD
jgi:hypothetical protein